MNVYVQHNGDYTIYLRVGEVAKDDGWLPEKADDKSCIANGTTNHVYKSDSGDMTSSVNGVHTNGAAFVLPDKGPVLLRALGGGDYLGGNLLFYIT
jgi:hypothetical protein